MMKLIYRVLLYMLGLWILAVGVAFSVNSRLGVSPANSLPYALSTVSDISMGTWATIVFCSYILIQALLLRRAFKPVNVLQIVFSTIFGYFVDLARWTLGDFSIPTYAGQLTMLAISILLVGLGLVFYLSVELVPMPMEGMAIAIQKKLPRFQFYQTKIFVDCMGVLAAIVVSLAGSGVVAGVREGTVISAVLIGKVMGMLMKPLDPIIRRICFDEVESHSTS